MSPSGKAAGFGPAIPRFESLHPSATSNTCEKKIMEKLSLTVTKRETKTPNALRREGIVPATLYGPGAAPESLQFSAYDFSRLPAEAFSHVIDLKVEGGKPVAALIRHVQRKSTTDKVQNVEFYRVSTDKKLTVTVPTKHVGQAQAVVLGGQLQEFASTIEIECLPGDIPDFIEVDLTLLKEVEDSIHFSDLKVPASVKILNPMDGIVIKTVAPKSSGAAADKKDEKK